MWCWCFYTTPHQPNINIYTLSRYTPVEVQCLPSESSKAHLQAGRIEGAQIAVLYLALLCAVRSLPARLGSRFSVKQSSCEEQLSIDEYICADRVRAQNILICTKRCTQCTLCLFNYEHCNNSCGGCSESLDAFRVFKTKDAQKV